MIKKHFEKEKAIHLRKSGHTYSEILQKINVAKSTLSLWLREVGLAKRQEHELTQKKRAAGLRGGEAKRRQRIARQQEVYKKSRSQIGRISRRELWLVGVALYWAEGSKEKDWRPGSGVSFINSDPFVIKVFLDWLIRICKVSKDRISFSIHIHENSRHVVSEVVAYWSMHTGFQASLFTKIYFKKHKIKTRRQNTGSRYYGILVVNVRKSSELCRMITGWTQGIVEKLGSSVIGNTSTFGVEDSRFDP